MCKFFIKFMSYTVLRIYGCLFFVKILIISKNLMFPYNSVHWQVDIGNETYVTFYHVCFKDSYDFAVRNLSNKHQ